MVEGGQRLTTTLLATLLIAASVSAAAVPCRYPPWDGYRGTKLLRLDHGSVYVFAGAKTRLDADGAPNAYHPDDLKLHCTRDTGFKGLDCPANAGYPGTTWWRSVLVPDPDAAARAYVQPAGSDFAGFFVSQTTLQDPAKPVTDPKRYVDSTVVPYLVFPRRFHQKQGTGALGDLGYAIHLENGKRSPLVVADIGPAAAELGEISIALAEAMGGRDPNPRTGAGVPTGKIAFLIFPNSRKQHRWPLSNEQMTKHADALLAAAGGIEGVLSCRAEIESP